MKYLGFDPDRPADAPRTDKVLTLTRTDVEQVRLELIEEINRMFAALKFDKGGLICHTLTLEHNKHFDLEEGADPETAVHIATTLSITVEEP